jgi:hypothetical protein
LDVTEIPARYILAWSSNQIPLYWSYEK